MIGHLYFYFVMHVNGQFNHLSEACLTLQIIKERKKESKRCLLYASMGLYLLESNVPTSNSNQVPAGDEN